MYSILVFPPKRPPDISNAKHARVAAMQTTDDGGGERQRLESLIPTAQATDRRYRLLLRSRSPHCSDSLASCSQFSWAEELVANPKASRGAGSQSKGQQRSWQPIQRPAEELAAKIQRQAEELAANPKASRGAGSQSTDKPRSWQPKFKGKQRSWQPIQRPAEELAANPQASRGAGSQNSKASRGAGSQSKGKQRSW
jgi:hypothetical protein